MTQTKQNKIEETERQLKENPEEAEDFNKFLNKLKGVHSNIRECCNISMRVISDESRLAHMLPFFAILKTATHDPTVFEEIRQTITQWYKLRAEQVIPSDLKLLIDLFMADPIYKIADKVAAEAYQETMKLKEEKENDTPE